MNTSKGLLFLITTFTLLIFLNSTLSAEITEPIRDGDYIYIDDSKTFLKSTYSATHGEDIEHWAMTKQFTGDCDMAIGFDGEVAWPTKVLLEDPHYVYWTTNSSHTFYDVTAYTLRDGEPLDYGNEYNTNYQLVVSHSVFDEYANESIWTPTTSVVAFDSISPELPFVPGTNYTITWHTEHSRLEHYRDISDRILANPIEYELDGKNLWFITKNIPMAANEMRKIVIEMDGKIELGERSYKYDIIWWPSHQTIAEARTAGNLYVLDPYWNTSWNRRFFVTYNQSAVSGTQNSFPIQYYFTGLPGLNANGTDIRVTYENHTQAPREIETVNSTTGTGSIFVLSNLSDIGFWFYYNNSGATEPAADSTYGSQAVWDSNHVFVMHCNNNPSTGNILDSTGNGHHGVPQGNMVSGDLVDASVGGYGKALVFESAKLQYLQITDHANFDVTAMTMLIRQKYGGYTGASTSIFRTTSIAYIQSTIEIRNQVQGVSGWTAGENANQFFSTSYETSCWQYSAAENSELLLDGISKAIDAQKGNLVANVVNPTIMSAPGGGSYASSELSEIRLSSVYRGDNYALTTHNNLNNPTPTGTAPFYNSTGDIQYYTDSLHYNASAPYNITIESDGTLKSNRSIVAGDDINDTAQSTGTSYIQINVFDNAASIVRNFTFTGDNLDWYQAADLFGSYSMKNSSGTVQTVADGNFTVNLVAGDYWIEQAGISIVLLSQTPSIIYTNSTGFLNISYGISHDSSGLNNTSVSFIYRNYDIDLSDSNHSIRPPTNNLASVWNFNGRILRAANRNETIGRLNVEDNDTITGGDDYTWSGLDENHTRLTIVPVNDTYTIVNISGTVHDLMPQMWYLDRTDQQEASKTQLAIHKTQNVLIKFWNFEIFKGNYDFLGVGYTDTSLSSNPALWPSDANPVNFYYINSSYDPATGGDPITSGYAVYMGSLNASGWTDHIYEPCCNAKYIRGFIDNNYLHTVINTTNISYLYFTSNTESSKPYYINMTNVATSTNRSFANTNTLWAGNNPPYSLQAYTPNTWFAFMKLNMSLDHKLYAADNNDLWGSSSMNRTNITQALFPPTTPSFYAFHNEFQDVDMNGTYHDTIQVQVSAGSDPDGGVVSHNITLHYDNKTYVATINGSAVAEDGVYTNITFNTTPYYSQTENYTLRVVATDDESETVTVWLGVNFSLDGSPRIISYSPETPISSTEGENQTFSITTNLLGNVTWYLDSVEVFNETDVNSSSYSNDNASLGSHNVTVITTNTNGSNSMMWDWNVRTELWSLIEDSVVWGISVAQYLVSSIGIVIVTAFSLVCILILMMLIGAALSVTKIIYR